MMVSTASSTSGGTYTITVAGNGGGVTQTTQVTLQVTTPIFNITTTPKSVIVTPGSSAAVTISTTVSGGFDSAILLSASGLPSGATVSFKPRSIAAPGSGSSIMTISTTASAPSGSYIFTVMGTGGGATHTANVVLTVSNPQFSIKATPRTVTITAGSSATVTITSAVFGGFDSAISLSASGQPSGTTVSFDPTSIAAPGAGSSTMTISTTSSLPTGGYIISVTGTGGGASDTTSVFLKVM
jgi:uncharacterized membrane protein